VLQCLEGGVPFLPFWIEATMDSLLDDKILRTLRKVTDGDADWQRLLRSYEATKEGEQAATVQPATPTTKLKTRLLFLEAQFNSLDEVFMTAAAEVLEWAFEELEAADPRPPLMNGATGLLRQAGSSGKALLSAITTCLMPALLCGQPSALVDTLVDLRAVAAAVAEALAAAPAEQRREMDTVLAAAGTPITSVHLEWLAAHMVYSATAALWKQAAWGTAAKRREYEGMVRSAR
jgi:hypothetical protein